MINVRKTGTQTAHQAEQSGTLYGDPLFEKTLCGRTIKFGEWHEVRDGVGWEKIIGHGPSFLLQPCGRCEAKNH